MKTNRLPVALAFGLKLILAEELFALVGRAAPGYNPDHDTPTTA
jgi:hypothetical protein